MLSELEQTELALLAQNQKSGMPQLTEDVLADILKRVPVKSLARFRCVSHSLQSLIKNPIFIKMELDFLLKTRIRILFSSGPRTILSLGTDESECTRLVDHVDGFDLVKGVELDASPRHSFSVKGHGNGLLCLILNGMIVLWNPSIREYRRLPKPKNFQDSNEVLGFGFDSASNDYKVVRAPSTMLRTHCRDYQPRVEVFSLNSNSWRKLPDEATPPFFISNYYQSVFVAGGLYWLTLDKTKTVILRFDLAEEKFELVPAPLEEMGCKMPWTWLGVLKGYLCVLDSQVFDFSDMHFDIWMTENDRTWTKMITVHKWLPDSLSGRMGYTPLCFNKNGELLLSLTWEGVMAYDPISNEYRKIHSVEYVQVTVYSETLVSPHANDEFPAWHPAAVLA